MGADGIRSRWPEFGVAAAWLFVAIPLSAVPVSHDVVWQMWIARQMLGGARLYVDILEVNPPLWFWMAIPVEWLGAGLGVTPNRSIASATIIFASASLALVAWIVKRKPARSRFTLLGTTAVVFLIIGIPDFAQREHLALIATVPYAALAASRAEGEHQNKVIALLVGCTAALGLALKHYFLLVPALLELWIAMRHRRDWTPARPEVMAMAAGGIIYAISIISITPEYLTTIVPMVRAAYWGYERPILVQIANPAVLIWICVSVVLWGHRRTASSLTCAMALAASAFIIAYFAQAKGWRYHALPATGFMFVALGTLLSQRTAALLPATKKWTIFAIALQPLVFSGIEGTYKNPHQEAVRPLMGPNENRVILILTINPSRAWPMVEEAERVWPSRHFAFWMIPAIWKATRGGELSPELSALATAIRAQTVEDLTCNPAHILIVDNRKSRAHNESIIDFFLESPEFSRIFAYYDLEHETKEFAAYRHRSYDAPESSATCPPKRIMPRV